LIVDGCKWGILAAGGWLILKVAPVARSIAKRGIPRSMVFTIIAAGFLNSAITILYNNYQIARLSDGVKTPAR
jgi:hypothetical protein